MTGDITIFAATSLTDVLTALGTAFTRDNPNAHLIFVFANWLIAGGTVVFVLFMMGLELLVAFLQAYIFALLTSVFIGLMQHEH